MSAYSGSSLHFTVREADLGVLLSAISSIDFSEAYKSFQYRSTSNGVPGSVITISGLM